MISYGGINLCARSAEAAAWVEANLTLDDLLEFERPYWPGRNRQAWAFAVKRMPRVPRPGALFWPTGATRFAVGHFLATDAELAEIRSLIYANLSSNPNRYRPLPLILSDEFGGSITTKMWLLPPRPLSQITPPPGQLWQQLYLLTLVDDRYWWWERAADVEVTGGTTTWADLYTAIATALTTSAVPVSISADAIPSAYLTPSDALTARYEALPLLLDAVAYNVGQRIVRGLDGTVRAQGYAAAKRSQDQQYGTWPRQAGGSFLLNTTQPPQDLQALVPASVVVAFAGDDSGTLSQAGYAVTVGLTSLALSEYPAAVAPGHAGSKVYRDSAVAVSTGGGTPTNAAQLATLAQQIAADYYRWRLGRNGVAYAGIVPYQPEGLSDWVQWELRPGQTQTRVERGPWNDLVEDLLHWSTAGGSFTGGGGGGGDVFDYLTVNNYETVNNLTVNNLFVTENLIVNNSYVTLLQIVNVTNILNVINWFNAPTFVFNTFNNIFYLVFPNGPAIPLSCPGVPCGGPVSGPGVPPPFPLTGGTPPGGIGLGGPPGAGGWGPPAASNACSPECDGSITPKTIPLTYNGASAEDCSDCGALNGNFTLTNCGDATWLPGYGDSCTWISPLIPMCAAVHGAGSYAFWSLAHDSGTDWNLTCQLYRANIDGPSIGGVAIAQWFYTGLSGDCVDVPIFNYSDGLTTYTDCSLTGVPSLFPGGGTGGGGGPETAVPCCDGDGTLPSTMWLTVQWRPTGVGSYTAFPSIPIPQAGSSPQWTVNTPQSLAGTSCFFGLINLLCQGSGAGNFNLQMLLNGTIGPISLAAGSYLTGPTMLGTSFCDIGGGMVWYALLDGSYVNQTPGSAYDVQFLVTR